MLPTKILEVLGISSPDELFDEIPEDARVSGLDLPCGLTEYELTAEIDSILSRNKTMDDMPSFLGGGVYRHFTPALVNEVLSRSEFYTAYTPYQPEASQGMLQALFEYQSFMSELTGMDAVNSSMYDWSTALGEAALMCSRIRHGSKFLIARSVSPERKAVLKTYLRGIEAKVQEVSFDRESGRLDVSDLLSKLGEDVFGVYIENPNYFGVLEEEVDEISASIGETPFVVGADPLSLAIVRPPSDYGADIVIGEGHHLGTAPNFGGPLLGVFGCRKEHIRKMPGRIIGSTVDAAGRMAFCMTLQTREQHIRRDKATSNICTNEALMAVAASAYLAALGRDKLIAIANLNVEKAGDLSQRISKIKGFESPIFKASHFNEFAIRCPKPVEVVGKALLGHEVLGGIPLKQDFPELGEAMLLAVSELHTETDIEALVKGLEAK
jgi:glycine cleavage system P protein (glycine dehydrogenase) subunit 1